MKKITTMVVLALFLLTTSLNANAQEETFTPQKMTSFLTQIGKIGFVTKEGEKVDATLLQNFITACNKNKTDKSIDAALKINGYEISLDISRDYYNDGLIDIRIYFDPNVAIKDPAVASIEKITCDSEGKFKKISGTKKKTGENAFDSDRNEYYEDKYEDAKPVLKAITNVPEALLKALSLIH